MHQYKGLNIAASTVSQIVFIISFRSATSRQTLTTYVSWEKEKGGENYNIKDSQEKAFEVPLHKQKAWNSKGTFSIHTQKREEQ